VRDASMPPTGCELLSHLPDVCVSIAKRPQGYHDMATHNATAGTVSSARAVSYSFTH
jgi:hypothetical protein